MYWDKQKHVLLCSFAAISVINIPLPSVKSLRLQGFFAELHVPVVMWGTKCTRILHFHFLRRKIESEHRKYMYIFILTCFTCKNVVIPLICILYFLLQKLMQMNLPPGSIVLLVSWEHGRGSLVNTERKSRR